MAEIIGWIVGIGGVIVAIVGQYFAAKAKGKAAGQVAAAQELARDRDAIAAKQVAAQRIEAEQKNQSAERANDEQAKVVRMPSGDVHGELRDQWTRD